jgi:hypothetical protein
VFGMRPNSEPGFRTATRNLMEQSMRMNKATLLSPDLQHPNDPVPLLKQQIDQLHIGGGGG